MNDKNKNYINFSKPFVDALKETFSVMMQADLTVHSPSIKEGSKTPGDITAVIGMNGTLVKEGQEDKDFKGQLLVSFKEDVYLKIASAMLMEEFTEYNDEVADVGGEIVNIVMGNAKKTLIPTGYEVGMATPSTIRGVDVEIKYPSKTTVIQSKIESSLGEFFLEICYQEN